MYYDFINQCPADGLLGCFQHFAIKSTAAMSNFVHRLLCTYGRPSVRKIPRSEIAGWSVYTFNCQIVL